MIRIRKWMIIIPPAIVVIMVWGIMQMTRDKHKQTYDLLFMLPGVYIYELENDFCRVDDTITIRQKSLYYATYEVTRKWGFTRMRNGKRGSVEHGYEHWDGDYNFRKESLLSGDGKDTLRYDTRYGGISKGSIYYQNTLW